MSVPPSVEATHGDHSFAPIDLIGPGTAGEKYLHEFQAMDPHAFAVVKIGGNIVDDPVKLERTARAIAFLHAHELCPVIVHGGKPQIDAALAEAGIASSFDPDGNRITTPEAALVIDAALKRVNVTLCESISYYGGEATSITAGVFEASFLDKARYGSVGKVEHVNDEPIHEAIDNKKIAVVSCMGSLAVKNSDTPVQPESQKLNINGDTALTALAKKLKPHPHKVISLTDEGAVLDSKRDRIKTLSPRKAQRLIRRSVITEGMVKKVNEAIDLLNVGVDQVVIISPEALLLELFTDGSGTMIEKRGKKMFSSLLSRFVNRER